MQAFVLLTEPSVSTISDISYLKTSRAFKHSDPLKGSPGSHSQLVSSSVGIMSSRLLLTFLVSIGLVSLHRYLCFSASISKLVTVLDCL